MHSVSQYSDLDILLPLMREKNVAVPVEVFHSTVNLVYHACESQHYDDLHVDMRSCLPQQFQLLVNDLRRTGTLPVGPLRILDVGCGTGQSAEMLLDALGDAAVESIDLLDTSSEMLQLCMHRECFHGRSATFIRGVIGDLPPARTYHVILTCSVLHHLPNLEELAASLHSLQLSGGIFLHLQDPNGDAFDSAVLRERMAQVEAAPEIRTRRMLARLSPARIARRIRRMLGQPAPDSYIRQINEQLLASGLISSPLTEAEIWSITDLRVHDGKGVSVNHMRSLLSGYALVSRRSYSFYGDLSASLPRRFRKSEQELIEMQSLDGMHIAAAWRRVGEPV